MPKITHLRTFEDGLWAKLEMDVDPKVDGSVHIFTDKEICELKARERKDVWAEIESAINRWDD